MGDWKLVAAGASGPWELYDMKTDRSEKNNLAASQPERVRKMAEFWKARDEEFVRQRETAPPIPKERM